MPFNRDMRDSGCPCKECGDRNPGCHDKCEKYKAWRAGWDRMMENRRKYMESLDTISDGYKKYLMRKNRDKRRVQRYDALLKNR